MSAYAQCVAACNATIVRFAGLNITLAAKADGGGEYTVTGLQRERQYNVKIAAINLGGMGQWSNTLHVSVP